MGLTRNSWKTENFLCSSDESYLRSRNQGDLSKADELSATIPRNLRVACIYSPPDPRAWHEQRLGVETIDGTIGEQDNPAPRPPTMNLLYPAAQDNSIRRSTYFHGCIAPQRAFTSSATRRPPIFRSVRTRSAGLAKEVSDEHRDMV